MDNDNLRDEDFKLIRDLVYKLTGISLSEAKRQLVKSRLQRRMRALEITGYREYYNLLLSQCPDGPEITPFINAITTNKTDFFRENHHFEYVTNHVVPTFVASGKRSIKIWHAGCSTGEEPYSLAITLQEALAAYPSLTFSQLASDIDTDVIAHAEAGVYAEERVRTIPSQTLKSWFLRGTGSMSGKFRVRPELQSALQFRRINLLEEPWQMKAGTRFDLIFCRNVLIYFDKPTQNRLFERFHERLNPGGFLFIGHSETMHNYQERFISVGRTIYQRPIESLQRLAA